MDLDKDITILKRQDQIEMTADGGVKKTLSVRFKVGTDGPFYERFDAGEQFADAIVNRLNAKALLLRQTGGVKPTETS